MSQQQENVQTCNEIYENLPCHDSVHKMQQPASRLKLISQQNHSKDSYQHQPAVNQQSLPVDADGIRNNGHYAPSAIKVQSSSKKRSMIGKEMIYATPLRKSDRSAHKTNNDHRTKISSKHFQEKAQLGVINMDQNSIDEKKLPHRYQHHQNYYHRKHYLNNGDDYHLAEDNNDKMNSHLPITDLDAEDETTEPTNNGSELERKEQALMSTRAETDLVLSLPLSDEGSSSHYLHNHKSSNYHHQQQHHYYQSQQQQHQQMENHRILNFLKDTNQLQKRMEITGRECINAGFSNLAREEHFANLVQQNFTSMDLAQNCKNTSSSLNKIPTTKCTKISKMTTIASSNAQQQCNKKIALNAHDLSLIHI